MDPASWSVSNAMTFLDLSPGTRALLIDKKAHCGGKQWKIKLKLNRWSPDVRRVLRKPCRCTFGGPNAGVIHATTKGLEWGVFCRATRFEVLKWYTYHCRPSLAMIVDLFVLPGLCFQTLSTFYCRFHCRPLNHFGLWPLCVCGTQTEG